MSRLMKVFFSLAFSLWGSEPVYAASLIFQAVPTPSTSNCPAFLGACYQMRVFYEDHSRSLDFSAFQMDVAVNNAFVPSMGVPPNVNSNASGGNVTILDENDTQIRVPFSLQALVGDSNTPPFDARFVHSVSFVGESFTIDSVQSLVDATTLCIPAAICAIQREALSLDRIYLGRFNFVPSQGLPISVELGAIYGAGAAVTDPTDGILRLNGAVLPVEFLAPEPEPSSIIGLVVVVLSIGRNASRRRGFPGPRRADAVAERVSAA